MPSSPHPNTSPSEEGVDLTNLPKLNGRYRLIRQLGRGGMGAVFLAEDTNRENQPLALKRMRGDCLDKKTVAAIRNEFLALATLEHPGLARVHDFGVDRQTGDYFFTEEFVDGVSLLKACRELDLDERQGFGLFVDIVAQILRALEFIHSRGLVHGDVKPDNILVAGLSSRKDSMAGSLPRAKLIDFGLAKREKEFGGRKVLGTTYYIAPETINGSQIDRRTDLYSLGAVLYHLVTRRVPFGGESSIAILKGHIERTPQPPCDVRPGLPEGLSDIILRLMEKRPSDRFQGALEVLEALKSSLGLDLPLETPETCESYLRCAQFLNGEDERRALRAAFVSACRVEPEDSALEVQLAARFRTAGSDLEKPPSSFGGRFVLLRGERGLGKRKLIRDLKNFVQTQGVLFLEVECAKSEVSQPHDDFEGLLGELRTVARTKGGEPEHLADAARLLNTVDPSSVLSREARETLKGLANYALVLSRSVPFVLHIHDLHKAGQLVAYFVSVLLACQTEEGAPLGRLLITGTSLNRADSEGSELHRLLLVPAFRKATLELSLRRLKEEELSQLLGTMFTGNNFPEHFLKTVLEESDGNPEVVREIGSFLLSKGVLRRTKSGWTLAKDFETKEMPGRVRHELKEKILRLPPPTLKLAKSFACLGNSTELELAVRLAGVPREQVLDCMQVLHHERLLEEDMRDGRVNVYSFVHSTAQNLLYQLLPPQERDELHSRAGAICKEYYCAQGKENPKKLAVHFLRARNCDQGIHYGLEAARLFVQECQPQKAVEMYREVLALGDLKDPALADRIRYDMAGLHHKMGDYRTSLEILQALSATRSRDGRIPAPAQVFIDLARNHTRLGEFKPADIYLGKALAMEKTQLISPWVIHILLAHADLYFSMGRHEDSLRYCDQVLESRDQIHDAKLLTRLYLILAENHFCLDKKEIAARYCHDALKVTDTPKETELLDFSLFCMGKFYKYRGRFTKAVKQFQLCSALRKKQGLTDGQADALLELGAIQLSLERPRQANRCLKDACSLYERTGNLPGAIETLNLLSESHRLLGEYEDSKKALNDAFRHGKITGTSHFALESLMVGSEIAHDRGDFDTAERYLTEVEAHAKTSPTKMLGIPDLRSRLCFSRGQFTASLEFVGKGLELVKNMGSRIRALPFLETQASLQVRLGRLLEAQRTVGALFDLARRYRLRLREGRGHLSQGAILAREGDLQQAAASFQKALQIFKSEESERDLVKLYLQLGTFLLRAGQAEQAFLHFEESLYLAKKLNLTYWKCNIHYASGLLESRVPQGDLQRAEECLRIAERYARQGSFWDLLWQVELEMGLLLEKTGRETDAVQYFLNALKTQKGVLEQVPEAYRESYLKASPAEDLERLVGEARLKAARRVADQKQAPAVSRPEPAVPRIEKSYVGLLGQSSAMREVFKKIEALDPSAPWVWLLGLKGTGKRFVARAIHEHLGKSSGRIWVRSSLELDKGGLEGFFSQLQKARCEVGEVSAAEGSKNASSPRFTLVVVNAEKLPQDVLAWLEERVAAQKGQGRLHVIATVEASGEGLPASLGKPGKAGHPLIHLPALSDRLEDLALLVEHFLGLGQKSGDCPPVMSPQALEELKGHSWTENIAGLKLFCERLSGFARPGQPVGPEVVRMAIAPSQKRSRREGSFQWVD